MASTRKHARPSNDLQSPRGQATTKNIHGYQRLAPLQITSHKPIPAVTMTAVQLRSWLPSQCLSFPFGTRSGFVLRTPAAVRWHPTTSIALAKQFLALCFLAQSLPRLSLGTLGHLSLMCMLATMFAGVSTPCGWATNPVRTKHLDLARNMRNPTFLGPRRPLKLFLHPLRPNSPRSCVAPRRTAANSSESQLLFLCSCAPTRQTEVSRCRWFRRATKLSLPQARQGATASERTGWHCESSESVPRVTLPSPCKEQVRAATPPSAIARMCVH